MWKWIVYAYTTWYFCYFRNIFENPVFYYCFPNVYCCIRVFKWPTYSQRTLSNPLIFFTFRPALASTFQIIFLHEKTVACKSVKFQLRTEIVHFNFFFDPNRNKKSCVYYCDEHTANAARLVEVEFFLLFVVFIS